MRVYSTVNINWNQGTLAIFSDMWLILRDYIQCVRLFSLLIGKEIHSRYQYRFCATKYYWSVKPLCYWQLHSLPTPSFPRTLPEVVLMCIILWLHCSLVFICLSQWQTFYRFYFWDQYMSSQDQIQNTFSIEPVCQSVGSPWQQPLILNIKHRKKIRQALYI